MNQRGKGRREEVKWGGSAESEVGVCVSRRNLASRSCQEMVRKVARVKYGIKDEKRCVTRSRVLLLSRFLKLYSEITWHRFYISI